MEKSIDLIELLKDCPSGLELHCPLFKNIYFDRITEEKNKEIKTYTVLDDGTMVSISFTREGKYYVGPSFECILFPKGKWDWKDFKIALPKVCKFKDGDIVTCKNSTVTFTAIFRHKKGDGSFFFHACYIHPSDTIKTKLSLYCHSLADFNKSCRLATGNEVLILENLLRKNNFIWNSKERALRFDFSKLNPYDKVLVRLTDRDVWKATFFSHLIKDGKYKFSTVSGDFNFCIPYKYNKHLIGTTENCQDCYIMKNEKK